MEMRLECNPSQFEQFGTVRSLVLDRVKSQLLVAFSDISSANTAYIEYKGGLGKYLTRYI